MWTVSGRILMKYQLQNPLQTVAGEVHLSRKWAKLTFSTICQKKSVIQISQKCEEELCTVSGPIIIKYQIQNPSQTVAGEVHHGNGQNRHFQQFVKKSVIQISQNCEDELCTVTGPIIIKYQIQNPLQTVAG